MNEKLFNINLIKVLDNHVIDYIPPVILMEKSENLKKRTKDGQLGMTIVGALSSDPRLVSNILVSFEKN
jgi:hypothetical protein